LLTRFFDADFPRPFGVFYSEDRPTYEDALVQQIDDTMEQKGQGNLDDLLKGSNTWTID
jgi:2-oxoglutarate ferredoxin oxidoreductase subunit beta